MDELVTPPTGVTFSSAGKQPATIASNPFLTSAPSTGVVTKSMINWDNSLEASKNYASGKAMSESTGYGLDEPKTVSVYGSSKSFGIGG